MLISSSLSAAHVSVKIFQLSYSVTGICLELEDAIEFGTPNTDWKFITDGEDVAPTNNFIHSLFQAVQLTVAIRMLSDTSEPRPYWAYVESLLTTMDAQLTPSLFTEATGGGFNDETGNEGEKERRSCLTGQHHVQILGKLFCDLFQQIMLTDVPLTIWLVMSRLGY